MENELWLRSEMWRSIQQPVSEGRSPDPSSSLFSIFCLFKCFSLLEKRGSGLVPQRTWGRVVISIPTTFLLFHLNPPGVAARNGGKTKFTTETAGLQGFSFPRTLFRACFVHEHCKRPLSLKEVACKMGEVVVGGGGLVLNTKQN